MSQNPFGKVISQILAKIKMKKKNSSFGLRFETLQHLFCLNMNVISVHIHYMEVIKTFRLESGFVRNPSFGQRE